MRARELVAPLVALAGACATAAAPKPAPAPSAPSASPVAVTEAAQPSAGASSVPPITGPTVQPPPGVPKWPAPDSSTTLVHHLKISDDVLRGGIGHDAIVAIVTITKSTDVDGKYRTIAWDRRAYVRTSKSFANLSSSRIDLGDGRLGAGRTYVLVYREGTASGALPAPITIYALEEIPEDWWVDYAEAYSMRVKALEGAP